MPVILETLQRCPLFAGLSEPDLAALAEHCHLKKVSAGQALFTRGEPGTTMYVLASGSVRLTVSSARGDEVVLQVVTPPQAFGEMAVIDDGTRVATATAREAATVVAVPRAAVQTLLRSRPGVAYAFLCGLVDLIREVDEHAVDLMLVDLRGRVAKAILTAVPVGSVPVGDSVDVDLRVHQGELAQRVGASRQHVNRALAALAADGAITRSGAHVTRVRPDLLAAAAAR